MSCDIGVVTALRLKERTPNLWKLNVMSNKGLFASTEAAAATGAALPGSLEELVARKCDIGVESFKALRLKERTPNLRKLDVKNNKDLFASAKAAATTGAALQGSLEELDAASCRILDSALLKPACSVE